jgi:hypothetical protein
VYIPKSPPARPCCGRLEDERDARLGVDLVERLNEQRFREWVRLRRDAQGSGGSGGGRDQRPLDALNVAHAQTAHLISHASL